MNCLMQFIGTWRYHEILATENYILYVNKFYQNVSLSVILTLLIGMKIV